MNRASRDKFVSGTDQTDLTTGSACWETSPDVFAKLNDDFGPFDVDLFADEKRALCGVWFGPGSKQLEDALTPEWFHFGSNAYGNPPYGRFVAQALPVAREMALAGCASTLLLPLRVTRAFRAHVLGGASSLLFCDRRIVFWENGAPRINPKTGKPDAAIFDSIIVRYLPGHRGGLVVGEWNVPR